MRYQLSLMVFMTVKIVALLSSKENDNEVFSNKSITTSENKIAKIYVPNISKML